MVQLDWSTGAILEALDQNGLTKNTIVIFTSDNGPVYDDGYVDGTTVRTSTKEVDRGHDGSGPYRGGKYQIYEGGTRVPFIVRWPGHVEPGRSNALISQIDFIASFAALLGIELADNEAIDSRNTLSTFLGKEDKGLPFMIEEARGVALRQGPWKFIRKQGKKPARLHDLTSDIGEQRDVLGENGDVGSQMQALLQKLTDASQGIRAVVR